MIEAMLDRLGVTDHVGVIEHRDHLGDESWIMVDIREWESGWLLRRIRLDTPDSDQPPEVWASEVFAVLSEEINGAEV